MVLSSQAVSALTGSHQEGEVMNVVMSSVQNAEEKEDEITRYLSALHYRLTVLLLETQNKQSYQGRASHILQVLIDERTAIKSNRLVPTG
jgi:hypothetical protein